MEQYDIVVMPKTSLIYEQAALLLEESFPHCYPGLESRVELDRLMKDCVCLVALHGTQLLGIVAAEKQYGITGWELHPLVVDMHHRRQGIGKALMESIEAKVSTLGGHVMYLGTDDEFFKTSLSEGDLFENTFDKIQKIKNKGKHPYEFYQKCGYQIVGVIPDANGPNKPDIMMAKRIKPL